MAGKGCDVTGSVHPQKGEAVGGAGGPGLLAADGPVVLGRRVEGRPAGPLQRQRPRVVPEPCVFSDFHQFSNSNFQNPNYTANIPRSKITEFSQKSATRTWHPGHGALV